MTAFCQNGDTSDFVNVFWAELPTVDFKFYNYIFYQGLLWKRRRATRTYTLIRTYVAPIYDMDIPYLGTKYILSRT